MTPAVTEFEAFRSFDFARRLTITGGLAELTLAGAVPFFIVTQYPDQPGAPIHSAPVTLVQGSPGLFVESPSVLEIVIRANTINSFPPAAEIGQPARFYYRLGVLQAGATIPISAGPFIVQPERYWK